MLWRFGPLTYFETEVDPAWPHEGWVQPLRVVCSEEGQGIQEASQRHLGLTAVSSPASQKLSLYFYTKNTSNLRSMILLTLYCMDKEFWITRGSKIDSIQLNFCIQIYIKHGQTKNPRNQGFKGTFFSLNSI